MARNIFIHFFKNRTKSNYFISSLVCILSLLFFIAITFAVLVRNTVGYFDSVVSRMLNNIFSFFPENFMIIITKFGSQFIVLFSIIAIIAFLIFKQFNKAFLIFFTSAGGSILTLLIKDLVERVRPPEPIIYVSGYSFPSGHAVNSTCFYGILIYLIFIYVKNNWLKWLLILLLGLLLLIIGYSRVYLEVHYPSDILGGYFLGVFWTSFSVLVYKKINEMT